MRTDLHRDPLGDMAADHVANRCSAEVVRNLARQFRRAASVCPRSAKVSNWRATAMENELAIRETTPMFAPLTIHKDAQFALKTDNPSLALLGPAFRRPPSSRFTRSHVSV